MAVLSEVIREISLGHINNNGLLVGQCLTAVGWVGGTVPEEPTHKGIIELSMSDVAGGGIATGLALAGRRPIYIVRFQGFQWYNIVSIVNYAAKSKEMWGIPCPIFVRSISVEGSIGPVASGCQHTLATRVPGITVVAPMTIGEYKKVWSEFLLDSDPYYVSEHKRSWGYGNEIDDITTYNPKIVIIGISASRFDIYPIARERTDISFYNCYRLRPFGISSQALVDLSKCKIGIIVDDEYTNGIATAIASDLMIKTGAKVYTIGLEDRVVGFGPTMDNTAPSTERILGLIKAVI